MRRSDTVDQTRHRYPNLTPTVTRGLLLSALFAYCGYAVAEPITILDLQTNFGGSHSIWGDENPLDLQVSTDIGEFQFDQTAQIGVDDWRDTRLIRSRGDTELGIQFDARVQGHHIFGLEANAGAGTVNTNLPYDVQLRLPGSDQLTAGNTITIGSSATLGHAASFDTQTGVAAELNQYYHYIVSETDFDICGGFPGFGTSGSDSDCIDFDPPGGGWRADISDRPVLIEVNDLAIDAPPGDAYDSFTSSVPSISTASTRVGDSLIASGIDTFLDVVNFNPLELVPGILNQLSNDYSYGGFGIDYALIEVLFDLSLSFAQDFLLTPDDVIINLDFGDGQVHQFAAGTTIDVVLPMSWSAEDGFNVWYTLSADFSNQTNLLPDFDAQLNALMFESFGSDVCPPGLLSFLGCFDMDWLDQTWGPLYSDNLGYSPNLNLYDDSHNFQYTSAVQSVALSSIARSVPEPGTLALLGIGLLGLMVTRRRGVI